MSDAFEEQEWVKFGVATTLSKQYAADQREFLGQLTKMLEHALPDETTVERRGGLFSKKSIYRVSVLFDGIRYEITDPGKGTLNAACVQIVRGIALKTVDTPVEEWLGALGAALEERAKSSASARDALAKMVS